ncbi:EcoRI family type II restriction endonuclease [Campylobacter sp. MIT 97-5078]|uniref:EcoRI family type II restriction endonuclease n=1 Tax=Campylobacter sp. MIT 97-5078 TaxID=1548153 RepID=UPI000512BBA8|nr:EcoRI family type II restriction endonuclease [Campylobacter sp. MIT 97-5078]KGI56273.1 restriction endonuclease [Campylobacter sp. MIT 97-5078]TQR27781.1 restriction endonuclease [Campylobacter sp. MIT 97-5078]
MPRQALRANLNQHQPKNKLSKNDDLNINEAMQKTKNYLEERFAWGGGVANFIEGNYYFEISKKLELSFMIDNIKNSKIRAEFDTNFMDREIKPDGGILFLRKKDDENFKKILLVSEAKRQGTNDERAKEGKGKQATGNAIERLGKNLTGIKAMLNHEKITPFVCFGWGCDFAPSVKGVLVKLNVLNEFYYLNKTYIFKTDGNSDHNYFSPVSMYFREEKWEVDEMYEIMKEIAETSLRYYIF